VEVSLHPLRIFKIQRLIILAYMGFLPLVIESAFTMSTIAAQEMLADSRVSRLAGFLFGENDSLAWANAWCNYFRPFKTRRCGLANEYQVAFHMLDEAGSAGSNQHFFCDQKRFYLDTTGRMVDSIYRRIISIDDEKFVTDCSRKRSAGYTFVGDGKVVIQLCPGLMEKVFRDLYVTDNILRLARDTSTRSPPDPTVPPTIDYFCLPDCVILNLVCITAVSCTD
jgi:hypothetical protein